MGYFASAIFSHTSYRLLNASCKSSSYNKFCRIPIANEVHCNDFIFKKYFGTKTDNSIQEKYDEGERDKILDVLNNSEPEELSRYAIANTKLKKILDKRKSEGIFKSIDELASVKGLDNKTIDKFFYNILNYSSENIQAEKSRGKLKGKILEPALSTEQINNINSVCSLTVELNYIGWAVLERDDNRVTDWDMYICENMDLKRMKINNIMETVWKMGEVIPRCDAYVMEALPVYRPSGADTNNPKAVLINLQRVQCISIITAFLNILQNISSDKFNAADNNFKENFVLPELAHNVFFLKEFLSSKLFKTYVGKERVSAQFVVDTMIRNSHNSISSQIMDTSSDNVLSNIMPVKFDSSVERKYEKGNSSKKEVMSQTLLLGITFMELCLCENLKAMKNLTSN